MKAFSSPDQMVSHSNGAERERRKARELFCDNLWNYKTGFGSFY